MNTLKVSSINIEEILNIVNKVFDDFNEEDESFRGHCMFTAEYCGKTHNVPRLDISGANDGKRYAHLGVRMRKDKWNIIDYEKYSEAEITEYESEKIGKSIISIFEGDTIVIHKKVVYVIPGRSNPNSRSKRYVRAFVPSIGMV